MQVTDETVELGCKAIADQRGYVWPDEFSDDEKKIGRENMRAALTAALAVQTQQGVEVNKLTPEGYVHDFIANGEKSHRKLPEWEQSYQDAGLIAEAERLGYVWIGRDIACTITVTPHGRTAAEVHRFRSALVDVPAVEPVAWQWRTRIKGGAWDAWENGRFGQHVPPFMDVEERPLYISPPPSREGEDSAEVTARRILDALRADDLGDLLRASDEVALPTIARALAATRSASATTAKGRADE